MNETTLSAADHDLSSTADAAPRIYKAFTERPAGVESLFVPPRRQTNNVTPTYKALTKRPADFEGFFVPPRRQASDDTPTLQGAHQASG
jgi:hypothetical protein